jgi:transcriptional regulator with XRE-family HTH domain
MIRETLSQYVRRVMKQRALNARDIERNSGKKIDNSYISKIINGTVTNLTANAIVALAQGLRVDPHELFTIVSGHGLEQDRDAKPDSFLLVDLMQQLVMDPQMMEAVQEWARLPGEDKARMLESLRFLNEQSERARQGGKQQKADKRQTSSG